MHKHVESNNFVYNGAVDIEEAEAKVASAKEVNLPKEKLEKTEATVTAKKAFWADVAKVAKLKGDVAAGEAGFATCMGCHTGMPINMGGVIPPKLDHAGTLYDKNYLIALIKDPAMASNVDHKYKDTSTHPMGSIKMMMSDDQQIADVVAYLMAKKAGEVTTKEAFSEACGRCHAMRYAKTTQLGDTPKFKYEKDALAHKIKVIEEQDAVKAYMGKLPPDLSIIIRARGHHFLETFVENPQGQLPGTSMPRVGLTKEGTEQVIHYLTEIGDANKPARDSLGWKVILFFVIFSILAYLWKQSVWSKLH
jgi:ubiquinol-cytochrome c reductase cytochrome c1 subunit